MAVPDTNTFSLQDVIDNIENSGEPGTFLDLQSCVDIADIEGSPLFPPENLLTYLEEFPNSLYGFRGYDHPYDTPSTFNVYPSTAIYVGWRSGTTVLTLTGDGTIWAVTELPAIDGVSCSPSSGLESTSVNVVRTNNTGSIPRQGTLKFSSKNTTINIDFYQEAEMA